MLPNSDELTTDGGYRAQNPTQTHLCYVLGSVPGTCASAAPPFSPCTAVLLHPAPVPPSSWWEAGPMVPSLESCFWSRRRVFGLSFNPDVSIHTGNMMLSTSLYVGASSCLGAGLFGGRTRTPSRYFLCWGATHCPQFVAERETEKQINDADPTFSAAVRLSPKSSLLLMTSPELCWEGIWKKSKKTSWSSSVSDWCQWTPPC